MKFSIFIIVGANPRVDKFEKSPHNGSSNSARIDVIKGIVGRWKPGSGWESEAPTMGLISQIDNNGAVKTGEWRDVVSLSTTISNQLTPKPPKNAVRGFNENFHSHILFSQEQISDSFTGQN